MSLAKPERNTEIYKRRKAGYTFKAIGNYYGISKQRAWVIVNNPNWSKDGLIRKLIARVKRLFNTDISMGG